MTLTQVEAFLILCEELHVGRTAKRMFLSASRVSRMVAALEAEVGGALFARTSRWVRITPLGARLRHHFRAGIDELNLGMEQAIAAARGVAGSLRVGFTTTVEQTVVHDLVRAFDDRHPECQVLAIEVLVTDAVRALRDDEIDVLMFWAVLDERDLTVGPAVDLQPRVLAVASSHPLAARTSVVVEDFADEPMLDVGVRLPRALADAMVPPSTPSGSPTNRVAPPAGLTTLPEVLALVERGKVVHPTVAALTRLYQGRRLAFVPIDDMPPLPLTPIWVTAHENARIRAFARLAAPRLTSPDPGDGHGNRREPSPGSLPGAQRTVPD